MSAEAKHTISLLHESMPNTGNPAKTVILYTPPLLAEISLRMDIGHGLDYQFGNEPPLPAPPPPGAPPAP